MPPIRLQVPSSTFLARARHLQKRRRGSNIRRFASTDALLWRGADPITRLGQSVTGAMEWQTSVYNFNKQGVRNLPAAATTVEKLIQAYLTAKRLGSGGRESRSARTIRRMSSEKMYVSSPKMKDFGDRMELSAFVYDGKLGRRDARSEGQPPDSVLDPTHRAGLESLLSRIFGKSISLTLVPLSKPHLDADILAAVVAQRLRDRANGPRRVIRDATWRAPLPSAKTIVAIKQAKQQSTPPKLAWHDLTLKSAARTTATSISESLALSRVSSVQVEVAGRLTKRLTANRSQRKMARRGATAKGPGYLIRGFRKAHVQHAFAGGKRRVGQYGVKVIVAHT